MPSNREFSYPSVITNSVVATPAMYIDFGRNHAVVAAFVKLPDGRKSLEFYFDQVCSKLWF